jgi:hypothetical protein
MEKNSSALKLRNFPSHIRQMRANNISNDTQLQTEEKMVYKEE